MHSNVAMCRDCTACEKRRARRSRFFCAEGFCTSRGYPLSCNKCNRPTVAHDRAASRNSLLFSDEVVWRCAGSMLRGFGLFLDRPLDTGFFLSAFGGPKSFRPLTVHGFPFPPAICRFGLSHQGVAPIPRRVLSLFPAQSGFLVFAFPVFRCL